MSVYRQYLEIVGEAAGDSKKNKEYRLLRLDKPLVTYCIKALKMSKKDHKEHGGLTKGEAKTILKRLGFTDAKIDGMKKD